MQYLSSCRTLFSKIRLPYIRGRFSVRLGSMQNTTQNDFPLTIKYPVGKGSYHIYELLQTRRLFDSSKLLQDDRDIVADTS